ncbi:hypothetical protein STCU_03430 [Strigomonas culicis]|uniref:LisH domain-containing protein n=1 Tax=Strigomonas culicis TaxID=28005 RepID=S9URQ1_9TRYP|nr:hypothetical protein STCU_03430 [Strigomonas culicis]|eukprot:EPY31489.1 hypothetical protein STCU_03430 [Strigomonas culicis]
MQRHLRNNGALRDMKAQLRTRIVAELMQHKAPARAAERPPEMTLERFERERAGVTPAHAAGSAPDMTGLWSAHIADALIENHLRRTNRAMSLSVFASEAEVPPLSDTGIPSADEGYLRQLLLSLEEADPSLPPRRAEEAAEADARHPSLKSVLQRLVEFHLLHSRSAAAQQLRATVAAHRHHCGTQTDDAARRDETSPLLSLECRLAAVDAKYALTFAQMRRPAADGAAPALGVGQIERRLAQHRADLGEELRAEYERKFRAFEQQQLQEVREGAAAQYRTLAAHKAAELRELERSLAVKSEQEQQRLALLREDVERQRLVLEKRQRDLTEAHDAHEREVRQHEQRQRELQDQVRALQVNCAKWEELCASRLMEADAARSREGRRMDDLRQAQAEHAAELRLKDEEIARLRFKIRALAQHPAAAAAAGDDTKPPDGAAAAPLSDRDAALYEMLVRTEELQRHTLRQQELMQEQQVTPQRQAEPRGAHWSAAWPGEPQPPLVEVVDETPVRAPPVSAPPAAAPAPAAKIQAPVLAPSDGPGPTAA